MAFIGVFEYDKDGKPVILKVMGKGTVEFWEQNFAEADVAIQYKNEMSEIVEFNNLHTNLLLTQLIKQKVITRKGANIAPLMREEIQKEVARTAWHWSRKKKLIKSLESKYRDGTQVFWDTVYKRVQAEGIKYALSRVARFIPQPLKDLWKNINNLIKQ